MPYRRLVPVLILLAMAAGCAKFGNKAGRTIGLGNNPRFVVSVNVADMANGNQPVATDLVLVLDKKLVKEVAKLTAKDWFDRRMQIQRDFPGKTEIISWEWVPRQTAGPIAVAVNPATKGAFLFAAYSTPGDHRAVIDVRAPIVINLQQDRFTVQAIQ